MADTMTPGNRLYIYRLLSEALGYGKQVPIERGEEALRADDVLPEDVGFDTFRAMMESKHFAGSARVEVFKKGRILLTMLRNAELDEMLAAAAKAEQLAEAGKTAGTKPAGKQGKQGNQAKGGKNQWAGVKATTKPSKPGEARRKKEAKAAKAAAEEAARVAARLKAEQEALEAAQRAEAERLAREQAERAAAEKAEREAREAEERARREAEEREAAARAKAEAKQRALDAQKARITTPVSELKGAGLRVTYNPYAGIETGVSESLVIDVSELQEETFETAETVKPVAQTSKDAEKSAQAVSAKPNGTLSNAYAQHHAAIPAAKTESAAPVNFKPTAVAAKTESIEPAVEVAAHAKTQPQPQITEAPANVAPPAPADPDRQVPSAEVLASYPRSISRDVFCPTAILSTLSRILPVQVDLMGVLDEDWQAACSMGTVSGSRNRATFPLRYLREDGMRPLELTLKRTGKPGVNMRWAIALIDGDDGTGDVHETTAIEGLPLADQGAWCDLGITAPRGYGNSPTGPIREFAAFAAIGTWDAALGDLARMAAPERWSYPGTEVRPSTSGDTRYGILREYLATTFHRIRTQEKLAISAGGDFAAFNTGLVTPAGDDIHACLEYADASTPWKLAGFAIAGSGELGRRITAELPHIPQAASYIATIDDVMPQADARIALDFRTLLDDCLGRLPRGFLREVLADMEGPIDMVARMGDAGLSPAERHEAQVSLARFIASTPAVYRRMTHALEDAAYRGLAACRRSYRVAVPVLDPVADTLALLLPCCLVEEGKADAALVLRRQPSGLWQGTSVMTLPRAYVCARVISAEQPRWLSADRALS